MGLASKISTALLFDRISRALAKRDYGTARILAERAVAKNSESVAGTVTLGDLCLFEQRYADAVKHYKKARQWITSDETLTSEDRRFIAAYINFRMHAVAKRLKGEEFENWTEFASKINSLPAKRMYKDVFVLPIAKSV
ncbi:MAG: hypothetical protein KDE03_17880 [Rhodobacteraceae bacterium]|nr:hypothetical protein [Paracoccaceae bacterium]